MQCRVRQPVRHAEHREEAERAPHAWGRNGFASVWVATVTLFAVPLGGTVETLSKRPETFRERFANDADAEKKASAQRVEDPMLELPAGGA